MKNSFKNQERLRLEKKLNKDLIMLYSELNFKSTVKFHLFQILISIPVISIGLNFIGNQSFLKGQRQILKLKCANIKTYSII